MSRLKSSLFVVGICLGSVGFATCVAGMIILWIVSARIDRVRETVFSKIDRAMVVVHQRVAQTRDRVAEATITAAEIEEKLRDWAKGTASERLAVHLNAAEKSERLASALRQADQWLESAESSAGLVQALLSIDNSKDEPSRATSVDPLVEEITFLRAHLAEAIQIAASIHDRIAGASNERPAGERVEQVIRLALRVAATLGSLKSRFETFADRLSVTQDEFQGLKRRTQRWILAIAVTFTLLIMLMAAGQTALCVLAWTGLRREKRRPIVTATREKSAKSPR
jgi:hypothetical protein